MPPSTPLSPYGNRLGWSIAAVLAALIAVGVWQLLGVNRLTPPTPFAASAAVRPLTMEVGPEAVYLPRQSGDPAALYANAVAALLANPAAYADLATTDDPAEAATTPAGRLTLEAAALAGSGVFGPDAATYAHPDEALSALRDLAAGLNRAAGLLAARNAAGDTAQSARLLEAEFALGARLFAERLWYAQAVVGLSIMRDAAAGLRSLAEQTGDATRSAALATFDRSAAGLQAQRLTPAWQVLGSVDAASIADHAGDVFALAGDRTADRLWRLEAVLKLGRYRYAAGRLADQLAVNRRLAEVAEGETDPAVIKAIDAARGLTVEQFRTVR